MPTRPLELISAETSPVRTIQRRCARIAASESTVLVLGDPGTGKELLARYIHNQSCRRNGPFIAVSCGAIPETLLESELFGEARASSDEGGATSRKGRIAMAEGGTLFLDDIGELSLGLQVKLARVLQDRSFEPVGSDRAVPANFRLMAATSRDLAKDVDSGRFRHDLYYRLLVCPVKLPALRDRPEDIPALFDYFWQAQGEQRALAADALRRLQAHPWPRNVRELENVVERLSVCSEGACISLADVEASLGVRAPSAPLTTPREPAVDTRAPTVESPSALRFPIDLPAYIRGLEAKLIAAALEQTGGNRRAAADLLGLQRTTLVEKLRRRAMRPAADEQDADVTLQPTGS